MMMMELQVVLLLALATGCWAMTVSLKEADALPAELRPIMPGGSWFDDMAVKRLHMKHHELKELGKLEGHKHEDDAEEMFIMSKLSGSPHMHSIPEVGTPVTLPTPAHQKQDTREIMKSFIRSQTHQSSELRDLEHSHEHDDEDKDEHSSHDGSSSHEFMEIYERELEKFFENFMSAMLQAEVGGVSIETREDDRPNDVVSA